MVFLETREPLMLQLGAPDFDRAVMFVPSWVSLQVILTPASHCSSRLMARTRPWFMTVTPSKLSTSALAEFTLLGISLCSALQLVYRELASRQYRVGLWYTWVPKTR
jgi:hypothetical protein